MRYKVIPHNFMGQAGFAIWDEKLSPLFYEENARPWVCSLDGQNPLLFDYMSTAYSWLRKCEQAGLDLESDGGLVKVYTSSSGGGATLVSHYSSPGPVVRELPYELIERYDDER